MNLVTILQSICNPKSPFLSCARQKAAPIEIKDLKIVRVVEKVFNDYGHCSYRCEIIFNDKVKASCYLTENNLHDLIYNQNSPPKLEGLTMMERCSLKVRNQCNLSFSFNHDKWASEIYENAIDERLIKTQKKTKKSIYICL
ncbi:MAG: hypothetical protein H0X29_10965 [Parachlamydiaceae bacterium]|nr:hypothetical protein [Parachlamydiaceae bacterium]